MVIDLFNYTVWKGPSSDLTDGEQLAEWVSGDINAGGGPFSSS